ncbi:unnamed protein product [Cunninghamella blakesleeana]
MIELDKSIIFRVVNIIVGSFMIIGGVSTIILGGFPQFIRGIFCILYGIMVFLFEFRLPSVITKHVSFMFSFIGRGIFYIFIGCILLNANALGIASGVIIILAGVAFAVLEFIPFIEAPSNMKRETMDDSIQHGDGFGTRVQTFVNNNNTGAPPPATSLGQSTADTGYAGAGYTGAGYTGAGQV